MRRLHVMNETVQPMDGTPAPSPKPPKWISATKLEANRQNGKKSTGPRTPEGKQRSRLNALKHGILARPWSSREARGGRSGANSINC